MSLLEMRDVSKSYGEGATKVEAICDIDLFVEAGHLVAVMGPSGSGKSTLLTIAGSLEEPTSGEVRIFGHLVVEPVAKRQGPSSPAHDRLRLPGLGSSFPWSKCGRKRLFALGARRHLGEKGPPGGHDCP